MHESALLSEASTNDGAPGRPVTATPTTDAGDGTSRREAELESQLATERDARRVAELNHAAVTQHLTALLHQAVCVPDITSASVFTMNYNGFFGYFDPEHICLDNEDN